MDSATSNSHRCTGSSSKASHRAKPTRRTELPLRVNLRNILVATLFLSLFIGLFEPNQRRQQQQQLAEGAKLKKEALKLLKSVAKGFVVSTLSTRKNFMPLPVPIPGKWQQILQAASDSGLLFASSQQQKQKFNPGSSKKYGSASSIGSGGKKEASKSLASRLLRAALGGGSSSDNKDKNGNSIDSRGGKSSNLKRLEKRVRVTAAKYAGKIIANQLPSKNSMLNAGASGSSSSSAAVAANKLKLSKKFLAGFGFTDRKSADAATIQQHNSAGTAVKQNDLLVTAYNLVKFMQQFRELDRTKLLDLNKMSLSNLVAATNPTNSKVPPIIAMNINNKKTLMNKLNYIHKLSTLNNRHRHDVELDSHH